MKHRKSGEEREYTFGSKPSLERILMEWRTLRVLYNWTGVWIKKHTVLFIKDFEQECTPEYLRPIWNCAVPMHLLIQA